MKKLLVLVMVLGMASLANAGLILDLSGTPAVDGLTIAGDASNGLALSGIMQGGEKQYTLTIEAVGPDISLDFSNVEFPGNGTAWMFGNDFSPPAATSSFVTLSAGTFMGVAAGQGAFSNHIVDGLDGTLILTDYATPEQFTTSTITVTPEPMTMSLLGLGGLALIRRRRA